MSNSQRLSANGASLHSLKGTNIQGRMKHRADIPLPSRAGLGMGRWAARRHVLRAHVVSLPPLEPGCAGRGPGRAGHSLGHAVVPSTVLDSGRASCGSFLPSAHGINIVIPLKAGDRGRLAGPPGRGGIAPVCPTAGSIFFAPTHHPASSQRIPQKLPVR